MKHIIAFSALALLFNTTALIAEDGFETPPRGSRSSYVLSPVVVDRAAMEQGAELELLSCRLFGAGEEEEEEEDAVGEAEAEEALDGMTEEGDDLNEAFYIDLEEEEEEEVDVDATQHFDTVLGKAIAEVEMDPVVNFARYILELLDRRDNDSDEGGKGSSNGNASPAA